MTEQDSREAETLLGRIETAIGAVPDRTGTNAGLITEILEAVNGIRSLLGIVHPR